MAMTLTPTLTLNPGSQPLALTLTMNATITQQGWFMWRLLAMAALSYEGPS